MDRLGADRSPSSPPPAPDRFAESFQVYEVRRENDRIYYFGLPQVDPAHVEQAVWGIFSDAGYEVRYINRAGEDVLVASPQQTTTRDGVPWLHVALFGLTVLSTLFAGALWFHVDLATQPLAIWRGWPFALALLSVLGIHELGHYALGRYHGVAVTLPYFIPIPTLIGTMGAVIRLKGRIPSRRALFDIGIAGPIAGLLATVIVSAIGLLLSPFSVPEPVATAENAVRISIGYPPLMQGLAWLLGEQLAYEDPTKMVHPIVIAGWVGMFVTFLNMIPVGQLDGGHVLRGLTDSYHRSISYLVPTALFGLATFLYVGQGVPARSVAIWVVWGVLTTIIATVGAADPVYNDSLDRRRKVLGVFMFIAAGLCFAPVPIVIV